MGEKKVDRFVFKMSDMLGEGSYGQVFKGQDEKTKEWVAIKMLKKAVINEDEYLRDGLLNEIKIMGFLQGNNVVKLIDVLETPNNYYIVQEYCDGGDFQHQLKKRKFLPQKEAMQFFVDVLLGMMELVKKGIIHRDLKPANILISKGIYKIADFGFSKAIDNFRKQMIESIVGTPLYQSLQLLKAEKYTSKSDIWSLGFIFYETLFGQTPWTARSIPELVKNITSQPLKFPQDKNVDPQIIDMLKGCLQLQEKDRLGWDQLYRHPCFCQSFSFYTNQAKQLEDKAMFLVQDLRFKVMKDKIDLEKVFNKYDKSGDKSLDMKELTLLLHEIDPKLEREEIEYMFNKIDLDGSNSIELNEFKKWLEENQVQMSMRNQPKSNFSRRGTLEMPKVNPNNSDQPVPEFDNSQTQQQQSTSPTQHSQQIVNQYQQQQQYQKQYSNQQSLQQQQVSQPIQPSQHYPQQYQQYPPQQQQYYPQQQYQQYQYPPGQQPMTASQSQQNYPIQPQPPYPQMNNSQQYNQGYQQPPAYVPNHQYPTPQNLAQERAMMTIQKLVIAIEKYNINIFDLFRKYDKSDSQTLDVKEFGVMLRKIDSQLTDQDISQAFWIFDVDRSHEITFKEFQDGIVQHLNQWRAQSSNQNNPGYPYQKY
ncbi:unnamed protein product (macronuclear) [Paramecium tetraurelia]|uniref:Protein kinase-like domain n=1 Tax=Paramecium tetraurelia TaxID=5888 RepID=A0BDG8_PARTE|nr:uncharacterized protein GSPATT00027613001 [Paramecium tetraurelia]CAK56585.1 unnamed protein product [Paramecium tetraurelia]|eukprot:XP_001423983.1 hypothetical protein (macronuclear) [Paramecium tetraurelia strain d4-2]